MIHLQISSTSTRTKHSEETDPNQSIYNPNWICRKGRIFLRIGNPQPKNNQSPLKQLCPPLNGSTERWQKIIKKQAICRHLMILRPSIPDFMAKHIQMENLKLNSFYCFWGSQYFYLSNMSSISRTKAKSQHQTNLNRSFRVGGSLAEQNDVKSFNRSKNNRSMAPSQPHRIQLPLFFNTPSRVQDLKKNLNKTEDEGPNLTEKVDNAVYITVMRRLKDYEMLAFGCRRAGKVRDEGRSYYSIGVLYDNIKKHKKAIEYYQKFLQVCKSINDNHGEALAYNCIGVDYQLLGEADSTCFLKAIEYHSQHEQLADVNGKFLASINLGLCYDRLDDQKNSVFWFQNALKHSVQMSNLSGQSLAIANIGKIGTKSLSQNKDKMKLFVQKYLKLSEEMHDNKGEMDGSLKLGLINSTKKNFQEGKQKFKKALELAQQAGDKEVYNEAKFGFAVVTAEKEMDNFLQGFSHKLQKKRLY